MSEQTHSPYSEAQEIPEDASMPPSQENSDYFEEMTRTPFYGTVEELAKEASEYIRKNPLKASLISLGAGFMVGLLLNRKR